MKLTFTIDGLELIPEGEEDQAFIAWWNRRVPRFSSSTTWRSSLPWAPSRAAFVETFRIEFEPKNEPA